MIKEGQILPHIVPKTLTLNDFLSKISISELSVFCRLSSERFKFIRLVFHFLLSGVTMYTIFFENTLLPGRLA